MPIATKNLPAPERLCEWFDHDPEGVDLVWRLRPLSDFTDSPTQSAATICQRWNSNFAGRPAGSSRKEDGRVAIRINDILYWRYRLIWRLVHGTEPEEIDHIDMNPSNDRLANLRAATHAQGMRNKRIRRDNTSGFKNVFRHHTGRWYSQITLDGTIHCLGTYDTPEEAHAAYCEASARLHGKFGRTK